MIAYFLRCQIFACYALISTHIHMMIITAMLTNRWLLFWDNSDALFCFRLFLLWPTVASWVILLLLNMKSSDELRLHGVFRLWLWWLRVLKMSKFVRISLFIWHCRFMVVGAIKQWFLIFLLWSFFTLLPLCFFSKNMLYIFLMLLVEVLRWELDLLIDCRNDFLSLILGLSCDLNPRLRLWGIDIRGVDTLPCPSLDKIEPGLPNFGLIMSFTLIPFVLI